MKMVFRLAASSHQQCVDANVYESGFSQQDGDSCDVGKMKQGAA
ncbi:hypothetical protein [Paenibacillus sp. 481]|nr:hypothetical protein [Paenibacillus sp. 481]